VTGVHRPRHPDCAWPTLDIERRILGEAGAELIAAAAGSEQELIDLAHQRRSRRASGPRRTPVRHRRGPADAQTAAQLGRYEQLERAFHARIFAAADRPRLAEIIDSLRDASAAYAHLHKVADDPTQLLTALQAQHEQLVTAQRRSDAQATARIAADHVWLTGERHGFDAFRLVALSPSRTHWSYRAVR
jgi:DNA-binding GntR family transcriptional regulator